MKAIRVRALTLSEVADLDETSTFWVGCPNLQSPSPLVRAALSFPLSSGDIASLREGVPAMSSMPILLVQNEYKSMYGVAADKVFVEDPEGYSANALETVGTQVSITFYAPGMEGNDVLMRVHEALRKEFGIGVLQLRTQSHEKVCEIGLPFTLGVPKGQIPKLI